MTEALRDLLQIYGALAATESQLRSERPGTQHETLDDYYEALGPILPDEPLLAVRISKEGQMRILKEGEHDVQVDGGAVTVLELPEDEFWFFRAFRPAMFHLERDLPPFIYQMEVVYAYAIFEGYLSEVVRNRLRQHPRTMGSQRKLTYEDVFRASSIDELVGHMVDREVGELLYLPLLGVLEVMRDRLGFRDLPCDYDERAIHVSLLRNCLLHNRGRIDSKLAKHRVGYKEGETLSLAPTDVSESINILRKLAYEIDTIFERVELAARSKEASG